jgi:hypothetical protein
MGDATPQSHKPILFYLQVKLNDEITTKNMYVNIWGIGIPDLMLMLMLGV